MKVAYIGTSDGLAEPLIKRFGQAGNEVYILSDKAFPKKSGSVFQYRCYRIPRNGSSFEQLLRSISADCIIFAGNNYMNSKPDDEYHEDMVLLSETLRVVSGYENRKFILLSSTDVYGHTVDKAGELQEQAPATQRGIHFTQEEQLVDIYRKQYKMDSIILRVSQLYASRAGEGEKDFLSRNFTNTVSQGGGGIPNYVYQPLHVSDLVSAIQSVMDFGKQHIYNICGSPEISASSICQLIARHEKIDGQDITWEKPDCVTLADDSLIRKELEWNNTKDLAAQITNGEIKYKRVVKVEDTKSKKIAVPNDIRQLFENLLIFAAFYWLNNFFGANSLFSNIDFMRIYIVLIAVSYGIRQSHVAAVLASAAYLYTHDMGGLGMDNFFSYAASILIIVEFVFTSLIISYTISALKEQIRDLQLNLKQVNEEYEDLTTINNENVLIKNEYELRILTSDSGLSRLYTLINRMMVQDMEHIIIEIMQIISEMIRSDTVAVYSVDFESNSLNLVNAMSDASAVYGDYWDMSESQHISDAVMRGEFYQGELGSAEPAVVIPVICHDIHEAVIVIKTLPYECETLYHVNLLKTMSVLLVDSMEKALDYYEQERERQRAKLIEKQKRSVVSSSILEPYDFCDRLLQAEMQAATGEEKYCVYELETSGNIDEIGAAVGEALENKGCLGFDDTGKLFALLTNVSAKDLDSVRDFFSSHGLNIVRVVTGETELEYSGQEEESEKAKLIEEQKRIAAGSGILEPYDFCDRLLQAEMQAATEEEQYCVFELEYSENIGEIGATISEALESTGCLGFDDTGKLFALLTNVSAEDLDFVQDFFSGYGLNVVRAVTGGMM